MRLMVVASIARAFGSLKGLDDATARAFVRDARVGLRGTVLRWGASAFCWIVVAVVGIIAGAVYVEGRPDLDVPRFDFESDWSGIVYFAAALALIATVCALFARDVVLALQIRRGVRRRGNCARCGYGLKDAVVDAGGVARCAECGTVRRSRPGEVRIDESGRPVLAVVGPARDDEAMARRGQRKWRVVGVVFGTPLLMLLIAGVWFERRLASDIAMARSERRSMAAWRELTASAQPVPVTFARGENQWPKVFMPIAHARRVTTHVGNAAEMIGESKPLPDFTMLYADDTTKPGTMASTGDPKQDALIAQAERDMAMEVIRRLRADGTLDQMAEWPKLTIVMRPLIGELDAELAVSLLLPELGMMRNTARMNAGRMELALKAGDRAEYLAALEQALVLGEFAMRQQTLIDRLVGVAIQALALGRVREHAAKYPDAEWIDAVEECLKRQRVPVGLDHAMRGERIFGLDALQWVYSSRRRFLRTVTGGNDELGVGAGSWMTYAFLTRRYGAMRDEMVAEYEHMIRLGSTPRGKRAGVPAPTALLGANAMRNPIAAIMTPALSRALSSDDQLLSMRRGTYVMLAIERSRRVHGTYPESLSQIVQNPDGTPFDLIDPYTGKPFGYMKLVPAAANGWRSYLLYSLGEDGVDNAGTLDPKGMPGVITRAPNTDAAVNPVGVPPPEALPTPTPH
ncbi:MAG: hypothetical protein K2W85_02560 [Phycisphaerales bacterium]|nr:hypothetical protein [Phycisphaerales bacterium]